MKSVLPWIFLALSSLSADTVVPQKASDLSLTIYNDNLAFVHDRRQVEIPAGKERLVYQGVAHSVIPASVIPGFSGVPLTLYSQNYVYDLITRPSMLRHSIDKTISFYTNGDNPTLLEGTLLSYMPSVMVREKSSGKIYTLEKPSQVIFPRVPPQMITQPSLVWEIEAQGTGRLGIDLKYLTRGLSWKSDYVLDLNGTRLDLVGWITVNNRSGVTYPNAQLTFLAGDVNRAGAKENILLMRKSLTRSATPPVKEEAFAGYHLYKIPFRTTLGDKQQKQIRFLERRGISCRRYGMATVSSFEMPGVVKLAFRQIVEFDNSRANHLGLPLPRGVVRMYSRDRGGEPRFIGESRIDNTPADEKVKLTVGTLFDATGERKITKFIARNHYRNVVSAYTLHNRGETPLTLKIRERIPRYGNSVKVKTDCRGVCSVEKLSAFVREFTIRLDGKKSYTFHSEFEVLQ